MNKQTPCLIFSDSGYLCDEQDVLLSFRGAYDMDGLRTAFDKALGRELQSFRDFCRVSEAQGDIGYRIYRLSGFSEYLFAFCEKNLLHGDEFTMVFLANDISEFYRFMSQSSKYFRETANRIIYELLYARNKHIYAATSITPEAFLSLSRVPHLAEAILKDCRDSRFCDICAVTEHALAQLYKNTMFGSSSIRFSMNEPVYDTSADTSFINLPLEAYISVFLLSMGIASSLSSDHSIDVVLTRLSGSADITISTHTNRSVTESDYCNIDELSAISYPVDSFSRIASVIALIADLKVRFSYRADSQELALHIVIGGEICPAADFKYSDPTDDIDTVLREMSDLLSEIN